MEDQNVTYDWWSTFNFRLPVLASSDINVVIRRINQFRIQDKFRDPAERVKAGIEIAYNTKLAREIKEMIHSRMRESRRGFFKRARVSLKKMKKNLKQLDPKKVLFEGEYTSRELERMEMEILGMDRELFFDNTITGTKVNIIIGEVVDEKIWVNDVLRTHEEMQEFLSYFSKNNIPFYVALNTEQVNIHQFIRTKQQFPDEIMFFTTDELGIMAFNKLEDHSHFVGVSGSPIVADALERNSFDFFGHDLGHATQGKILRLENFKKISERIDNISNKEDREKAELALFMYRHEIAYGLFGISGHADVGVSDYTSIDTNLLSPSELSQLRADAKEYARENIYKEYFFGGPVSRFLDSEDLQEMLPESVNINNPEEVKNFLNEAVGIFVDTVIPER